MRWGALSASAALVLGGVIAFAPSVGLGEVESAAAVTTDCAQLAVGEPCTIRYEDAPGHSTVVIPSTVHQVTVMLAGASGAAGDSEHADPGPGGVVIATVDTSLIHELDVWLGEQGHGTTGGSNGWAGAGDGGKYPYGRWGYGGGAASALTYTGNHHDDPLIVAGGGGGGGAYVGGFPGGAGGYGGDPAGTGANGYGELFGAGGKGGGAGHNSGGTGSDGMEWNPLEPFKDIFPGGGGGGGGGGKHGGEGGGWGGFTPDDIPDGGDDDDAELGQGWGWNSPGGGGGGKSWASDAVTVHGQGAAPLGHGYLMIFPGTVETYECNGTQDKRVIHVPSDVFSYAVIAVGGAGGPGNNIARGGHGAVVSGMLDVFKIRTLDYWVGCSGDRPEGAGMGYGRGGHGGHAPSPGANDGGRGGGATALAASDGTMLIVAGGGGGAGGDIAACMEAPGDGCGGAGGSGGGSKHSGLQADGARGGTDSGGAGGRAAAHHHDGQRDINGGGGVEPGGDDESGGGGGGGSGYPMGGNGGHHAIDDAGGGGGAGGSYFNDHHVGGGFISTSGEVARHHDPANGYLLMLPIVTPQTDLTVRKTISGAADGYAQGPFTMTVTCDLNGHPVLNATVHLEPGGEHTWKAPVGSSCTVTETGTGGASTPAPPQTLKLTDSAATVTMSNAYAATSLAITVRSEVIDEDNQATDTVTLDPGELGIGVSCTLAGHELVLPSPVVGGAIPIDGVSTFGASGVTVVVDGLPVGAECLVLEQPGSGATVTGYIANGEGLLTGQRFHLIAAPNTVQVGNGYGLTALVVNKAIDGGGVAPPGVEFVGSVACELNGNPVVFQTQPEFSGLTVPAGRVVHGLPVNAQCTITETQTGGAHAVTYAPARTVKIATHPAPVTITNTYDTGTLVVSSGASGAGAGWANTATTQHLTCTIDEGEGPVVVLDQVFQLPPAGGWTSFTPDEGASCTVAEETSGGASSVQYWSSADPTPAVAPVAVTVGTATATLHVENVFDAASIGVSVDPGGTGERFAEATSVTVGSCTFNGLAIEIEPGVAETTLPFLPAGGTASIPHMVLGAQCTATMTDTGGATTGTATVTNGSPDSATFPAATFTAQTPGTSVLFETQFDVAALTVTKALAGAAAWAANTPFTVQVTCTLSGEPIDQLGPGGVVELHYAADGTLQPDRGSEALGQLPVGAECALDETEQGGATTVTYAPSPTVDVDAAGTSVTITNTFEAAPLSVSVALGGNDAGAHTADPFTFELGCTFNGQTLGPPPSSPPTTFPLLGGQSAAFDEFPVGADCAAEEIDSRHATSVTPALQQSAVLDADGVAFPFTNTFDLTTLTLEEVVTGPGSATYGLGQVFTPEARCTYPNGDAVEFEASGLVPLDADNGFTGTIEAPVGTTCTAVQSLQLATTQTVSAPVELLLGGEHTVTITSDYQLAQLTVSKSALGIFDAEDEFAFDTQCVWSAPGETQVVPFADGEPDEFTLRSGEARTVDVLPYTSCTNIEAPVAGVLRVDSTASGAGAHSGGASAVVAAMDTVPAAVAVSNFMPGSLPVTGAEWRGGAMVGLLLLVVGGAVLLGTRLLRRRRIRDA